MIELHCKTIKANQTFKDQRPRRERSAIIQRGWTRFVRFQPLPIPIPVAIVR